MKLTETSSLTLDVIRFLSSQAVLFGHAISFLNLWPTLRQPHIVNMQGFAVVIFLFLSGFLITYSTYNKRDYNFRDYFIDRFSRIYSAVIPCLLVIFIIDIVIIINFDNSYTHYEALDFRTLISNVFMLQDYPYFLAFSELVNNTSLKDFFYITSFGSGRPLWTLAVEWWIYISFGLIFFYKSFKNKILFGLILAFSISTPLFYLMYDNRGSGLTVVWIMGFGGFFILKKIPDIRKWTLFLMLGLLLLVGLIRLKISMFEYDLLAAFSFCIAILCLLKITQNTSNIKLMRRVKKVIRFLADYSFTLYLIHYSVIELFININLTSLPLFIICIIVSNLLAILIAIPTEMNHKKLADFLKRKYRNKQVAELPMKI